MRYPNSKNTNSKRTTPLFFLFWFYVTIITAFASGGLSYAFIMLFRNDNLAGIDSKEDSGNSKGGNGANGSDPGNGNGGNGGGSGKGNGSNGNGDNGTGGIPNITPSISIISVSSETVYYNDPQPVTITYSLTGISDATDIELEFDESCFQQTGNGKVGDNYYFVIELKSGWEEICSKTIFIVDSENPTISSNEYDLQVKEVELSMGGIKEYDKDDFEYATINYFYDGLRKDSLAIDTSKTDEFLLDNTNIEIDKINNQIKLTPNELTDFLGDVTDNEMEVTITDGIVEKTYKFSVREIYLMFTLDNPYHITGQIDYDDEEENIFWGTITEKHEVIDYEDLYLSDSEETPIKNVTFYNDGKFSYQIDSTKLPDVTTSFEIKIKDIESEGVFSLPTEWVCYYEHTPSFSLDKVRYEVGIQNTINISVDAENSSYVESKIDKYKSEIEQYFGSQNITIGWTSSSDYALSFTLPSTVTIQEFDFVLNENEEGFESELSFSVVKPVLTINAVINYTYHYIYEDVGFGLSLIFFGVRCYLDLECDELIDINSIKITYFRGNVESDTYKIHLETDSGNSLCGWYVHIKYPEQVSSANPAPYDGMKLTANNGRVATEKIQLSKQGWY